MNKEEIIKFRVTTLEKMLIQNKADNTGFTVSEYCRNSALNKKIGYKLTQEEIDNYKMLVKYHKNFSALSNLFKAKDPSLSGELRLLMEEIKEHLKKFR